VEIAFLAKTVEAQNMEHMHLKAFVMCLCTLR